MCRIASLFLLRRLKGSMSGEARDFNNIETRTVIKFLFPARQGAEGNSGHSDRNIRGTHTQICTNVTAGHIILPGGQRVALPCLIHFKLFFLVSTLLLFALYFSIRIEIFTVCHVFFMSLRCTTGALLSP
jgi:hypothetical protein